MKRILAIVLTCVMLLSVLPTVAFAEETAKLKVSANVSKTVNAGDTVEFTVSLGAVKELTTLQFALDIPAGLTYVAGSGTTVNGLAGKLHMATANFDETDLKFAGYGSGTDSYTGTSDLTLMTFKCRVTEDAATSLDVSVKDMAASVGVSFTAITCVAEKATIRVNKPATSISLDHDSLSLSLTGTNKTATLTATVVPSTTTDTVTWSVSPAGVVELAGSGNSVTVKALKAGRATITAKAGNQTATCRVEVSTCDHEQGTSHVAVPATCAAAGTKQYWDCTKCSAKYVDNAWTTDSNATVDPQKPHDLEKTDAVEPTCTTAGNYEYWTCKNDACGHKVFKSDKKTETTVSAMTRAALGHNMGNKVAAKDPTCIAAGNVEYYHCSRCNKNFEDAQGNVEIENVTRAIDPNAHDAKKVEAKDPTCQVPGNTEYYECSRCHKFFKDATAATEITDKDAVVIPILKDHVAAANAGYASDATNHWKVCKWCGEKVNVTAHDFGADGTAKCTCGAMKDGKVQDGHENHTGSNTIAFDANKHWHTCSEANCAGHVNEQAHTFSKTTETVNGKKYEVMSCSGCGYVTRVEVKNTNPGTTGGNNVGPAKNPYEKNDTTKKDNGKTVESGRTFDAGIALYVGLSLLSVTGGALVIGKKKEF